MTIYSTRYQARKDATGSDVIVKVCGGYVVMDAENYLTWRKNR